MLDESKVQAKKKLDWRIFFHPYLAIRYYYEGHIFTKGW